MHDVVSDRTVHPLVRVAFRALDVAGIRWCLLHDEANLESAVHDIDLLVAEADNRRIAPALAKVGFVPLDGIGAGAHAVFGALSGDTDAFVILDVTFELSYGPSGNFIVNWLRPRLETGAAAVCCARRVRAAGYWVLSPADAFWALLLNCIVDKQHVAARHQERLTELALLAMQSPLVEVLEPLWPAGWSTALVVDAAAERRFDNLVGLGSALVARATAARPIAFRARAFSKGTRRLRRDLTDVARRRRSGLSVALLGPDGAGKSSTAHTIAATWPQAHTIYMGLWRRDDEGHMWRQLRELPLRPWRIWWRYLRGFAWRLTGALVIFDRYTYDALAPTAAPLALLKRAYLSAISHTCPAPDVVVVLDASAEVMHARKPDKEIDELQELRGAYRAIAARAPHACLVNANRDAQTVCADVRTLIWNAYVAERTRST